MLLLADETLGLSWGDRLAALGLLVIVAGPIIGLLFKLSNQQAEQTSQQAGTNARLDSMNVALGSHIARTDDRFDNYERRLDHVEQKQVKHDYFWENLRGSDQRCQTSSDNQS